MTKRTATRQPTARRRDPLISRYVLLLPDSATAGQPARIAYVRARTPRGNIIVTVEGESAPRLLTERALLTTTDGRLFQDLSAARAAAKAMQEERGDAC